MPAARAVSTMARCTARPASPVSPKPEATTTADFTPRAAHCATASTAFSPPTMTIARSGTSGSVSSEAWLRSPCTSSRAGLIG